MSKTATATATAIPAAPAAPGKKPKSSRLKWILIAALPLLAAGSAGGWYYLQHGDAAAPGEAKQPERPPQFMNLDSFTVNLAEEGGDHYLQIGVVYQVEDSKVVDNMKLYMPVVRDRILRLLSAKRPSDIASPEGKRKLIDELIAGARASIPGAAQDKGIRGALLSAFVIQ